MDDQILITVGREFGSGGHVIAKAIAERMGIRYCVRKLLDEMFEGDEKKISELAQYDEKLAIPFLHRRVRGHSSSPEENLAKLQFEYLRDLAEKGESMVLVGRCGEWLFRDYPNHVSIFVTAEEVDKVARVMDREGKTEIEARSKMARHDKSRAKYHNTYSDRMWGMASTYDLCVNASRLGIEGTTDMLLSYIEKRREAFKCQ